jgi:hypothetical protein
LCPEHGVEERLKSVHDAEDVGSAPRGKRLRPRRCVNVPTDIPIWRSRIGYAECWMKFAPASRRNRVTDVSATAQVPGARVAPRRIRASLRRANNPSVAPCPALWRASAAPIPVLAPVMKTFTAPDGRCYVLERSERALAINASRAAGIAA